eukprot:355915-Chlamydomonas_euryale.AAC.3
MRPDQAKKEVFSLLHGHHDMALPVPTRDLCHRCGATRWSSRLQAQESRQFLTRADRVCVLLPGLQPPLPLPAECGLSERMPACPGREVSYIRQAGLAREGIAVSSSLHLAGKSRVVGIWQVPAFHHNLPVPPAAHLTSRTNSRANAQVTHSALIHSQRSLLGPAVLPATAKLALPSPRERRLPFSHSKLCARLRMPNTPCLFYSGGRGIRGGEGRAARTRREQTAVLSLFWGGGHLASCSVATHLRHT